MGCDSGMANEVGGCYGDCYAAKSAKLYGYDFKKTVLRHFESNHHRREILRKINSVPLDFIRIGSNGDPSEDWGHTVEILKSIQNCNKEIVIITRHWTLLSHEQLQYLGTINICVNTSVSALDKSELRERCLNQYQRLKPYCKSILRIVSCDFNMENETGHRLAKIQSELFKNESIIDTVFRPNKRNQFLKDGVIKVTQSTFLGKKALVSKLNKSTYLGKCSTCHEMCGLNVKSSKVIHPVKPGTTKQLLLFKRKKHV